MRWEDRFRETARRQGGAVGIDQLPTMGCVYAQWQTAKRSPRWRAVTRRVLVLDGTPVSDEQRVHSALLDAGGCAALHGRSSLSWMGLPQFDLSNIDVTRRRGDPSRSSRLARVHRLRDLRPDEITIVRGVPCVAPLRAIWSEASRFSNDRWHEVGVRRVGALLDDANRAGLLTWQTLHDELERLQCSGRAGTRIMREVAGEREPGTSPTESRNEDRFEELIARSAARPLRRQVHVGGPDLIGRADFADPDLPLVVEVNSDAFHSLPSDQEADERRYGAMVDAGFTVAVIWEKALWRHPSNVLETVRRGRSAARRGRAEVVHSFGCPWPADDERIVVDLHQPPSRG